MSDKLTEEQCLMILLRVKRVRKHTIIAAGIAFCINMGLLWTNLGLNHRAQKALNKARDIYWQVDTALAKEERLHRIMDSTLKNANHPR